MARAELRDIVRYICAAYPHSSDLSNARLTKIVYLADWRAALAGLGQISNIRWIFNNYGPWVPDVYEAAKNDPLLEVNAQQNYYGSDKRLIRKRPDAQINIDTLLDTTSRAVLDSVFADTQDMYFGQFIDYVYDTPPVKGSHRKGTLDLAEFAKNYGQKQVPVDLAAAAIAPTDYARARDTIDLKLAQALLGQPLAQTRGIADHEFDIHVVPGLRIDELTLNPRMDITRESPNRWRFHAEGDLRLTALFPSWGELPPELHHDGYYIHRKDWIPGEIIIGLNLHLIAEFDVTKQGKLDAEPLSVRIEAVTAPAAL